MTNSFNQHTTQSAILPIHIIEKNSNNTILNSKTIHFQINSGNTYNISYKFFMPKGFHLANNINPNVTCKLVNDRLNTKSITFVYVKDANRMNRPAQQTQRPASNRPRPVARPIHVNYIDSATGQQVKNGNVYGNYGQQINVTSQVRIPAGYTIQNNQNTFFQVNDQPKTASILVNRYRPVSHADQPQQQPNRPVQGSGLHLRGIREFKARLNNYDRHLETALLHKLFDRGLNSLRRVVAHLFTDLGYRSVQNLRIKSAGQEISGVIRKDPRTVNLINTAYVRVRKYNQSHPVTISEVRDFVTSVMDHNSSKGIFIATSSFNADARREAERHSIDLIDGRKLAHLMIQNGIGIKIRHIYKIISLDDNFFN